MNKILYASKHQRNSSNRGFVYDEEGIHERKKIYFSRVNCWENFSFEPFHKYTFHALSSLSFLTCLLLQTQDESLHVRKFAPFYSSSSCIFSHFTPLTSPHSIRICSSPEPSTHIRSCVLSA